MRAWVVRRYWHASCFWRAGVSVEWDGRALEFRISLGPKYALLVIEKRW